MATRILHVSDLHFGAGNEPILERGLVALIERVDPEVVIASGDLTNRGRRDEHDRAAAFLKRLGPPVLAVPGNHDIPYTFPARFTSTWSEFERQWQTTEPEFVGPAVSLRTFYPSDARQFPSRIRRGWKQMVYIHQQLQI